MAYFSDANAITRDMGGKAYGLQTLIEHGCRVPPFFVLPFTAMRRLWTESENDVLQRVARGEQQPKAAIASALDSFAFPKDCLAELQDRVRALGAKSFAVRSSCAEEDGREKSFAGQFASVLGVSPQEIPNAVKTVWLSSFGADGKRTYADTDAGCRMSVIVQAQIQAERSGVCFSSSPTRSGCILIESVAGAGETLVSGKATPERYEAPREAQTIGVTEIVRRAAIELETALGYAVDTEWCFANGVVYFLQLRPVTKTYAEIAVPQGEWRLYVRRKFPWYVHSVQTAATAAEPQRRLFGFHLPVFAGILVNGEEYYTRENDEQCDEVWAHLSAKDLLRFYKNVRQNGRRIARYTTRLYRRGASVPEDVSAFETAYVDSYVPMMMRPDEYLAGTLRRAGVAEEDVRKLSFCKKPTALAREKTDFYRLCRKPSAMRLRRYVRAYGWMRDPMGETVRPYTEADVRERLQSFSADEAKERLRAMRRAKKAQRREKRAAQKALTPELRVWADLLDKFVYLRTRTAEQSDALFFAGRTAVFPYIAAAGMTQKEILLCGYGELAAAARGVRPRDRSRRAEGNCTVWQNGAAQTVFGLPPKAVTDALRLDAAPAAAALLRGAAACPGRVIGKVRVVHSADEAADMQKGEILVASMTTPELTDAIHKSAGFITDEGGVSCHAAIVSRELGMPCLVGTRTATRLLTTGQTVELDAFEGTVSVL